MSDPLKGREEGLFTLTLTERHWMRILVTLNASRQDANKNANGPGTVRYLTGQAMKAHELSQVAELITDRLGGVEDKAPGERARYLRSREAVDRDARDAVAAALLYPANPPAPMLRFILVGSAQPGGLPDVHYARGHTWTEAEAGLPVAPKGCRFERSPLDDGGVCPTCHRDFCPGAKGRVCVHW